MKLALRPTAVADIRSARDYYEESQSGLGSDLAQDLDRLFARLQAFPRSAPVVVGHEPVRRAHLRRFPFAVFYVAADSDRIEILRLIHTSRSPDVWPRS